MAKYIIVGSKDCTVPNVVSILKEDVGFSLLYAKWIELASDLDIPHEIIYKMRQENLLGMTSFTGIIFEIINHWVSRMGRQAYLNILIESLEKNHLRSCAEGLENAFGLPPTSKLEDQDVSSEKSDDETKQVENEEEDEDEGTKLSQGSTTSDRAIDADPQISPDPKNDDDQRSCIIQISASPTFKPPNIFELLGSILEVSPFCEKLYKVSFPHKAVDMETEIASFMTSKRYKILKFREAFFNILCCITILFSLIDFFWEGCQFINHIKGTNKVGSYIVVLRKLGTIALRLAFLHLGYSKVPGFAEDLENEYPKKLYKKIFYGKYYLISEVSIFFVIFLTSTGFWMPRDYYANYSEMDKIVFLDNFGSFSKNYYTELTGFFAIFRFFLLFVEQYALDLILIVAIIFHLEMRAIMTKAKKYFHKSKREKSKQLRQKRCVKAKRCFAWLRSCLKSCKDAEEIAVESVEVIKNQLQFEYINIRGIFRSTNKLVGHIYSISLFIGLLYISSIEDILLDSQVNILHKVEYVFVFAKLIAIVYLGCSVSNKLQDLHGEDYASFFVPVDISVQHKDGQNADFRSSQRHRTIKRQTSTTVVENQPPPLKSIDLSALCDLKKETPIGLGSHPFSMDVKFLAHHIGLALFTIFLGIVSTREGSSDCDITKTLNNSLIVNGTYYECILAETPVGV